MRDMVNSPAHYNAPNRSECWIEMIEKFGIEKFKVFCELNVYKYYYRHELKNEQEDLDKAQWYENKLKEITEAEWKALDNIPPLFMDGDKAFYTSNRLKKFDEKVLEDVSH